MSHSTQPLAANVTIDPTLITSLTGPNNHTGIYLDADTVNSSILITTNDTDALYIDKYQNVGINNSAPAAQLDINSVDGKCIQLTYNNTANTAAIGLASNGIMSLSSTGQEVNVDSASNFNVKSHNGTSTGLKLNNVLVLATADQLNYNKVTPGAATASKALVVDINRDISNVNSFSASQLTGTLQTAAQPNITSVGTLNITDHDLSTQGLALDGTLITASATQINYTNVSPGTASASKALVVDSNKDIVSIRNLSAVQLTGTLQTASQPNITSVGTLQGLNLNGSLTGVNALGIDTTSIGRSLIVNNSAGNCLQLCYDTASGTPVNYVDLLVSSGGNLLLTPSGGNVNITTHDGSTQGLMLDGTLVLATADQINYLSGTVIGSASAGKALIVNSNRNIDNINNLLAVQLTGTLQTAAQPNITSVNTLNVSNHNGSTLGLQLNGTLITASASELNYVDTTPGTAEASKALVVDSSSDISGINSLSATSLTGTLQTAAQPNITSVGTLTSVTTSGSLTLGTTAISESDIGVLDGVTPGTASASKVVVLDSSSDISGINSLSATSLTGTLQTAAQPNITSVGTLTSVTTSGSLTLGATAISESEIGVLDGVTPGTVSASKALVVDSNKDISALRNLTATNLTGTLQTAAQPNITSVGTLTSVTTSGALTLGSTTIDENEIGMIDGVTPGTAAADKALVVDSNKDISSIRNLSASSLTGTIQTATQPNISSVNVLNVADHNGTTLGLSLGGVLLTATAAQINSVFGSGGGGGGTGTFTNLTVNGTLSLANADGSTLGLSLANTLVTASGTELNYLDGATPGTAVASKALVLDSNLDISGINSLSTNSSITIDGVNLTAVEANYIDTVTPGTASAGKAIVLDSNSSVTGINSIAVSELTLSGSVVSYFGTQLIDNDVNHKFTNSLNSTYWLGYSATSPTLEMTISTFSAFISSSYYAISNSPSGFYAEGYFGNNFDSNNTYSFGILWQAEFARFIYYFGGTSGSSTLKYSTSTNGINWTVPDIIRQGSSSGITFSHGTTVRYHAPSGKYVFFINDTFWYSTNGITGWTGITVSNALETTDYRNNSITLQILGNYVTHLNNVQSGSVHNVMYWNGTAWSQVGTINTTTFKVIRAYSVTEDRLYMIDQGAQNNGDVNTLTFQVIDNFSTRAFNTWASAIQVVSIPNVKSIGNFSMIYDANYDIIIAGQKYIDATPQHTIRIMRIQNKLLTYSFVDGPTESPGVLYKAYFPPIEIDWNNSLVLRATKNDATVNSVYWQPTSSSNGISFGSTTIGESEIGVLDAVNPGTASASRALVLDSSSNISGINSLSATNLTGTLQTAAQPNITSVGTLTSISTSGTLTLGSTTIDESTLANISNVSGGTPGVASAGKSLVLDSNLDIAGINSLSANSLTGTLQTAAQPNITSVGTLTSITTSGSLTVGSTTINQSEIGVLDGVTPGTVSASKALVVDSSSDISGINSLNATSLTGTLQTVAQPNITSVGTLTSISTSGNLTLGSTTISESEIGVLDGVTPGTVSASKALVVDSSSDISGINSLSATSLTGTLQTAAQPNITSVGTLTSVTTSGSLTLGSTTINQSEIGVLDGVTPGTVSASKALVVDSNKDISTLRNLTATNLTGTLQTAAQPNITSVGTLTSVTTSGDLTLGATVITESEIGVLDGVTPGTAAASKGLVLDSSSDISGINSLSATSLSATSLTGTLQTAAQPNITSVGTLTSVTTSGSLTLGSTVISESEIGVLDGVTLGTADASKALVLDSSSNVSGINSLSATSLTGTLQTAAQPNITSVGTLTSITTSGSLTVGSTTISQSEIGVLDGVNPGFALGSKALVLNSGLDVSGINSLSATELIGTLQTAAQPNITSVGILTNIATSGTLTISNTTINENEIVVLDGVTPGTASASRALVLNTSSNISGINSLSATSLTGTLQTAAQPNITSIGTLTSITTSGSLTLGSTTISESEIGVLDGVTPGTAAASKALVLNSSLDISGVHKISSDILSIGTPANSNLPVEIGYTTYQFSGAYAYNNNLNAHGLVDANGGISANYSLRADGRILVTGEIELTSDRRLKKNIEALTIDFCRSFVATTTPVRFNWRNDDSIPDYGYIAQDVLKAGFDDLVTVVAHPGMEGSEDSDGFINPADAKFVFSPGKIVPILALNQKELFKVQDAKDIEIAALSQRLAYLESLVSDLLQKK